MRLRARPSRCQSDVTSSAELNPRRAATANLRSSVKPALAATDAQPQARIALRSALGQRLRSRGLWRIKCESLRHEEADSERRQCEHLGGLETDVVQVHG
jgi:hypothetical protein